MQLSIPLNQLAVYYIPENNGDVIDDVYEVGDKIFVMTYSNPKTHCYGWIIAPKDSLSGILAQHYKERSGMGNGGHACGYYNPGNGVIEPVYAFAKGVFTLRNRHLCEEKGDFCLWDYDPVKKS